VTSEHIQIRKNIPSGTIILNRTDKKNALSREMVGMLKQSLEDFLPEKKVRSIILTGAGDTFCTGTDLVQIQETSQNINAMQTWHEDVNAFRSLIEYMLRYPKPIIAAINGPIAGSGLALALASDIVVTAQSAEVALPEPLRGLSHGLTPPLLSFRVGSGPAARVLLGGASVDSKTGKELGIFHHVVDENLVWVKAQEIAQTIADGARESYQMTKQFLNDTVGESLFMQLSIAAANMAAARTTPAAKEGIAAFLEKRETDWEKPLE